MKHGASPASSSPRYAAHALMMPYQPFLPAPSAPATTSTCCARVSSRSSRREPVDDPAAQGRVRRSVLHAGGRQCGNRFRRAGARFPMAASAAVCPKLAACRLAQPGQVLVEAVEMPDGGKVFTIARTLEGPQAFNERPRRTALLIGCEIEHRDEIVLRGGVTHAYAPTPIGPASAVRARRPPCARGNAGDATVRA